MSLFQKHRLLIYTTNVKSHRIVQKPIKTEKVWSYHINTEWILQGLQITNPMCVGVFIDTHTHHYSISHVWWTSLPIRWLHYCIHNSRQLVLLHWTCLCLCVCVYERVCVLQACLYLEVSLSLVWHYKELPTRILFDCCTCCFYWIPKKN